jgi:molybdopterin/thiamine biosynthesis adenylyltransferase
MNIEDEKVKDRWSRYIGAMGIEAVAKQAESRILISGLGPLGVEIAKNIVLAGCKELILHDDKIPNIEDLSGQFFLTKADVDGEGIGFGLATVKTRAEVCKEKI